MKAKERAFPFACSPLLLKKVEHFACLKKTSPSFVTIEPLMCGEVRVELGGELLGDTVSVFKIWIHVGIIIFWVCWVK